MIAVHAAGAMTPVGLELKVPFHSLVGLAHDFSGEERYFEKLHQANSRLAKAQGTTTTYDLGLSVGETGAAAGFLAIVMMAFLHWKGVHKQPTMAVLSCDGPERGAVVLGPFTKQAFARQGR